MTMFRLAAVAMTLTWPLWAVAFAFAGAPRALCWGSFVGLGIWLDRTQPDLRPHGDL